MTESETRDAVALEQYIEKLRGIKCKPMQSDWGKDQWNRIAVGVMTLFVEKKSDGK